MTRFRAPTLVLILAAVFLGVALAQADAEPESAAETFSVQVRPVAAFGVAGGFPGYQTVTGLASVQYRWLGGALRAGWGTAGIHAALDVRGYPPVPLPVPLYGAVGVNLYSGRVAYHAALGAHVPLTLRLRLDLEGGVAWVPLGFERRLAPHVQVGLSWAIPFDPGIFAGGDDVVSRDVPLTEGVAPGCVDPAQPNEAGIDRAVAGVARDFLTDAQAVYGSLYTDLSYSYEIVRTSIEGPEAEVVVEYAGSVTEIATGERLSASGEAFVALRWTGCRWSATDLRY